MHTHAYTHNCSGEKCSKFPGWHRGCEMSRPHCHGRTNGVYFWIFMFLKNAAWCVYREHNKSLERTTNVGVALCGSDAGQRGNYCFSVCLSVSCSLVCSAAVWTPTHSSRSRSDLRCSRFDKSTTAGSPDHVCTIFPDGSLRPPSMGKSPSSQK